MDRSRIASGEPRASQARANPDAKQSHDDKPREKSRVFEGIIVAVVSVLLLGIIAEWIKTEFIAIPHLKAHAARDALADAELRNKLREMAVQAEKARHAATVKGINELRDIAIANEARRHEAMMAIINKSGAATSGQVGVRPNEDPGLKDAKMLAGKVRAMERALADRDATIDGLRKQVAKLQERFSNLETEWIKLKKALDGLKVLYEKHLHDARIRQAKVGAKKAKTELDEFRERWAYEDRLLAAREGIERPKAAPPLVSAAAVPAAKGTLQEYLGTCEKVDGNVLLFWRSQGNGLGREGELNRRLEAFTIDQECAFVVNGTPWQRRSVASGSLIHVKARGTVAMHIRTTTPDEASFSRALNEVATKN